MKGRLEHELQTLNKVKRTLETLPSYVTDYYYSIQGSSEPSTLNEYIQKIKVFLEFIQVDISQATATDAGRFIEKIKHTTNSDGTIRETSFSYRRRYWTILNGFFSFLARKGIIKENLLAETKLKKGKDQIVRPALSMDDLNTILKAVKTGAGSSQAKTYQEKWKERDLLILFLFMNTGMRRTALSEINIEDISFEDKKFTVIDKRHTEQKYDLTEEIENAVLAWLKKREELLNGIQCDALFISTKRQRLSSKSIERLVKKYSKEALGFEISPHKLRAAFITNYYEESGNDLQATCQAVGHADVSTTSRYITRKNNSRTEAMNFMSKNLKI